MAFRRHRDWLTPAFDLPPVAPAVGPFPSREFLRTLTETLDRREVTLLDDGTGLLAVCEEGRSVTLAGDPDLVDYRSPLGEVTGLVQAYASGLEPGTTIQFDSLPEEAAQPLLDGLLAAGLSPTVEPHAVAAVLTLPSDVSGYLSAIGKKQRHELRRKRRRYEEAVGRIVHETHVGPGWWLEEFFRLHRSSSGPKGTFMTGAREELFRRLADTKGWRIDLLRAPEGERATAALFSFADDDGYYLYNSAYDPALSEGSPGVVMIGSMIERAIAEGLGRFDFLKGDEVYKFRLGATERPLVRIRVTV